MTTILLPGTSLGVGSSRPQSTCWRLYESYPCTATNKALATDKATSAYIIAQEPLVRLIVQPSEPSPCQWNYTLTYGLIAQQSQTVPVSFTCHDVLDLWVIRARWRSPSGAMSSVGASSLG